MSGLVGCQATVDASIRRRCGLDAQLSGRGQQADVAGRLMISVVN